jgi:peptidyl-tRNA hydrolase, PTH1 family
MWPFRHSHVETDEANGDLYLVVGLGNPGGKYEGTRHNIGFMVVERFAERLGVSFTSSKHRADTARGTVSGASVLLAEPLTFMNDSGIAVRRLLEYYKVPPERMIVVCDDLDLPFGRLRIRMDGSSGGNGGLRSIIREIGTDAFTRLRVGIDRPSIPARAYVLQPFTREQEAVLPALVDVTCDAIEAILARGPTAAMNEFNRDWLPALR